MKKICLLGAALMASLASFAQTDVIKDVERELKKGSPDYAAAINKIQPALSDPTTANTMMPWYLAGKASFGQFEKTYMKARMGEDVSADDQKTAGKAFVDGYKYYRKAIQLDSLPDEKGKIKPKKAKEMLKNLQGYHVYATSAADFLNRSSDYDDAYEALEIYVTQPYDAFYGSYAPVALPDSVWAYNNFLQAFTMLASDQVSHDMEKVRRASTKLIAAMDKGYVSPELFTYGMIAASRLEDNEMKALFAQAGYNHYGTTDIAYIGELINNKLETEDYDGALEYANKAIAETTPTEENSSILSQLYSIQGIINQRHGDLSAAKASYEKSLEINPNNGESLGNYAQAILTEISQKMDADLSLSNADFEEESLKAASLLEKAYNLDENKYQHFADTLYRIYYNLGKNYIEQTKYWEALK